MYSAASSYSIYIKKTNKEHSNTTPERKQPLCPVPKEKVSQIVKLKGSKHFALSIYFRDKENEGPREAFKFVNSPLES